MSLDRRMIPISLRLPKGLIEKMDETLRDHTYASRSDFIRYLLISYIKGTFESPQASSNNPLSKDKSLKEAEPCVFGLFSYQEPCPILSDQRFNLNVHNKEDGEFLLKFCTQCTIREAALTHLWRNADKTSLGR